MTVTGEELYHYVQPHFQERFDIQCNALYDKYSSRPQMLTDGYLQPLITLCENAMDLQSKQEIEPVKYLCISYLQSGLLTGCFSFRADLYDSRFYLDQNNPFVYWEIPGLFELFQEDIEYFRTIIKRKYVRIKDYQLTRLKSEYAVYYYSLVHRIYEDFSELIVNLFSEVEKEVNWKILFGQLRDETVLIWEASGEQ